MKQMSEPTSGGVKEDDNVALEYNTDNVKKARLNSTLAALLDDPVLADVPKKPTLSDVDTLISLELGSAMRVSVLKLDGTSFGIKLCLLHFLLSAYNIINGCWLLVLDADVAVMNSATVKDLKLAVKKKVNDMEQSKMGHRHISWKHVWRNFCLSHHNEKLLNDDANLQDHDVRNHSQVHFIPYVMSRASKQHSRRRKHRFFHGLNRRE
ncbi:putative U11/U12 small nuclear ribonucleoprotein 25kDa protein [Helianthus annuus]|nr:putative U11/U12 small nuclear ribonucleoprotein 25kDa protein [Helianthus annuus]